MNVKFYPALPKEYREPVWNILCESNNDFVPPLSARYNDGGEEEFDLTKVKIDRFPTIYFNKIISLSFLIAFDDETGEVMGFTAFKHGYSSDELHNFSPLNYISTTCVSKKYRNKGVAQRLYQFLEEELPPSFRLPYIARRTWSTNYPQIHLYRKKGFFPVYIIENDRGVGVHTIYFVKKLPVNKETNSYECVEQK